MTFADEPQPRVRMTRDATIISARQLGKQNNTRLQALAREGIGLVDLSRIALRLEAFYAVILDDDQRAELELIYQEKFRDALDQTEEQAREAQRRAKLSAPPLETPGWQPHNRADRRHPPR